MLPAFLLLVPPLASSAGSTSSCLFYHDDWAVYYLFEVGKVVDALSLARTPPNTSYH